MSWLYSQALVEEYLGDISSDGEQSVQSNGNPTQLAYLPQDRMTAFSRLSRFGMTFKPFTADRGEALLTSYLADFHARTLVQPERERVLVASDQVCGEKWQGSFAKYDPDTHSLRTHQCSLLEDSMSSCQTLPAWGLMRDGECWEQPTLELRIRGTESGLRPTPTVNGNYNRKGLSPTSGDGLATAVMKWPTPRTKGMCGGTGSWELLKKNTTIKEARAMGAGNGGTLNPTWVEWLMGWPLEWTDLKPLETDKFQQWQQQHSTYYQDGNNEHELDEEASKD
jgi:hypothetical protein